MTATFERAKVFDGDSIQRISPTRIRHSVATELAGYGDEDLDTFTMKFMKHKPSTAVKSYIKNWSQRESVQISMKCFKTFNLDDAVDIQKGYEHITGKTTIPTSAKVLKWMEKQKKRIKVDFGNSVDDQGLEQAIALQTDSDIYDPTQHQDAVHLTVTRRVTNDEEQTKTIPGEPNQTDDDNLPRDKNDEEQIKTIPGEPNQTDDDNLPRDKDTDGVSPSDEQIGVLKDSIDGNYKINMYN